VDGSDTRFPALYAGTIDATALSLPFFIVAKRKGAEVDRDAHIRLQQVMGVDCLGRREMHRMHEPAGEVGANWQ